MDNETDYHLAETESALGADLEDFIVNYLPDNETINKRKALAIWNLYQMGDSHAEEIVFGYKDRQWSDYLESLNFSRLAVKEARLLRESFCE